MKRLVALLIPAAMLFACNNETKQAPPADTGATVKPAQNTPASSATIPDPGAPAVSYTVEGKEKLVPGSILVKKDKDQLSPSNDFFAIITATAPNGEYLNVNFVFALKPGTYPVVGLSYTRNAADGKGEVYGGLMGGKPRLTPYRATLTECTSLGSNNRGGKRWKISGTVEGEVTINAMGIMKMNKEHPDNIKVAKIRFSNLTFDDNWEEMMKKVMKKNN